MPKEVEVRSFLNEKKIKELVDYFKKNAKYLGEENQTTYYL